MIKKVLKRSLSIFLTLVLIATTFFIFDPSVLKLDASATVNVDTSMMGGSLPSQTMNAPETIYLKPGLGEFQYFSLINIDTGGAANSTSTTGKVLFSNGGASNVKLFVNNFWVKTSATGSFAETSSNNLVINGKPINTKGGITSFPTNGTRASGAEGATEVAKATGGSIDCTLEPGTSLVQNYTEGYVYMIEWCVEYKMDGKYHYACMYTGIYAPRLQITGVTGLGRETGTGNTPEIGAFAFVAGAMDYAVKGNRSHIYTGKTAGLNAAPLVLFNGSTNGGTASISNSSTSGYYNTANFPDSDPKTIQVNTTSPNTDPCRYYTSYSDYGSYTNPNPSGTIKGETNAAADTYSGVAYMVVDTSRFTNYNQIPNLSVGFVKYYGVNGGYSSSLDYIRAVDSSLSNSGNYNINAEGVDTGEHNELDGQARTYGLYKLGGGIYNGGFMLEYKYNHGINLYLGHNTFDLKLGVGLHTTTVNKDGIRKAYCKGLKSNIDNIYYGSYASYYDNMKTQAKLLCDPTATSGAVSVNESTIVSAQEAIVNNNTVNVLTFYVPETIYLAPSTGNMNTFKYYVDRANAKDGALRTGENTSGNIYLNVPGASSVSISCSGATVTMGTTTGTDTISTTITAGTLSTAIAQNTTAYVEWTATYILNGVSYSTKAYSMAYAPLCQASSTAACTIANKFKRSGTGGDRFLTTTYWLTGGHSVTNHSGTHYSCSNGSKTANTGSAYDPPLIDSSITTGGSDTKNSSDTCKLPAAIPSGSGVTFLQITDSNNAEFSGYGGTLNVTVDTSRYSNYSQIPNMRIGYDVNYSKRCGQQETGQEYMWIDYSTAGHYSSVYKSMLASAGKSILDSATGTRQYDLHLEGPIQANGTTYDFGSHVEVRKDSGDGSRWLKNLNHVYLYTTTVSKADLRAELNKETSTGKQSGSYTSASWSTYITKIKEVYDVLGKPAASQTDVNAAKNKIGDAKAALVKNTGTIYAEHRTLNGQTQSVTGSGSEFFETESMAYNYGDTAYAYENEYVGYTFDGAFAAADLVNNTTSNGNSAKKLTWDNDTRKITFKDTSGGSDNFNAYPDKGNSIIGYFYIPVTPGATMTFKYTAAGDTPQFYAFYAGKDMKTVNSAADGKYLQCKDGVSGDVTMTFTVPSDVYYLTFRMGNRTPNGTTTFTNLRYTTTAGNNDKYKQQNVTRGSVNWDFYYAPDKTDIIYNPDGGTFNGKNTSYTYSGIAMYDNNFTVGAVSLGGGEAATPTKTGYTFNKWVFSINSQEYSHGDSTSTPFVPWKYDTDSAQFTATWTANKYKIKFNGNGATSGEMADINNVEYDAHVIIENAYVRTGYTFTGWKVDNTGTLYAPDATTGKTTVSMLSATNNAEVTLYAQWTPNSYTATAYAYSNTGAAPSTYANNTTGGTVQVDSQTAGESSTKSITYGNSYKVTATAKTGYYLVGWYNSPSTTATGWAANPASTSTEWTRTMGGAATNAYARFDVKGYNINMYENISDTTTVKNALTNVKYGTTQTISVPSRTGYIFGGWYDTSESTGGTQVYGTGTSITIKDHGTNNATVDLYARWTANEITVQYANGGGSGTGPASHKFFYGDSVTPKENTFTAPAKKTVTFNANSGTCATNSLDSTYSFANWKSDKNSKTYAAGTAVSDSLGATGGTVTLTAQWTQSSVKLPNATRTGYTFDGWYTQSEGGDKVGGYNTDYTPSASTTLYAHWTVATKKVNVYAYGNSIGTTGTWTSGVGGSVNVNNDSTEESVNYGNSYTINATPAAGYAFKGWYTTAPTSGTTWGTSVSPNASYTTTMGANDVVYYAKFDIVYCTVTAYAYSNNASALTTWANNATGGTVKVAGDTTGTAGATSSGKVITGKSATLTATPAAGYHFAGWYSSTNVSGSTSDTSATLTVPFTSEGATVNKYARFDINQNTLKVNPNNGKWNGFTTEQTYTKVGGSTLSIPNPTRTGYNFSAWTKNPTTLNGTLSGTTYTFPNNVFGQTDTITASWTPITYTIAFNKKNAAATGSMSNITGCKYDEEKILPANGFTLTGYDFAGWKVADAGDIIANGAKVKNLTDTDNNTVTLYAQWTIKSYNVTVVPYSNTADTPNAWTNSTVGGTVTGGGSKTYGGSYTIDATPATGYDFVAWYTTAPANGTGTEASTSASYTATMGAAAITYYAKFSIKSFTVTAIAVADSAASTALSTANATTAGCKAEPASSTVYYNENASLTATAGTGYTFAGWFTDAECKASAGTSATITPKITANKTYYAKFTVKKSTVSVVAYSNATGSYAQNTNGGTVTVEGVSPVISAAPSITMGYKGSYKVTATPATGYTFDGWFTDTALTASAAVTATATFIKKDANETLYAKFSLSASKLTLYAYNNTAADPNNYTNGTTGGTVAINNGTAAKTVEANINYGETATITATPATGYTFDGWYSTVTGGLGSTVTAWTTQFTPTNSKSESMTTARTYYAKFTIKSITVTFNPAGGSISSGSATATAYYNTALNAPVLTRPGYTLLGWSESQSATEATYPVSTISAEAVNTMVNAGENKTLYAVWQAFNYTIFLAAASDTANAQGTYKIGTSGTTSGTSTGGTIAYKSGVTKINAGDTILDCLDVTPATGYELVDVIYKVTSQPNANSDVTSNLTSSSWYSANNAGYKEMPEFENESSIVFIAYFKVRSFTATAYAYSNTTYDAAYRNTAAGGTVKVGQNGAPGATADESAFYGDSNGVTFYATANTGYTFDGWYKDAALTVQDDTATAASVKVVLGDDSTNANINKRYAKFSINTHTAFARAKYYTDGYDDATGAGNNGIKGGTVTVSSESGATATTTDINAKSIAVKYREEVTYTANPETGYEFVGWYVCTDTADTAYIEEDEAIETDEEYTIIMADADIRIHAKFVPINFVLTLNPNGVGAVNGPTAQVTLTYDRDVVLNSSAKPTRSSYKFIGWDETSSATEATYKHTDSNCTIGVDIVNRWFNESQSNGGVKVIYAVWETAKYIVTLDDQGGTGGESNIEAILDNPLPPLESLPTYEGYTFAGYFTEPGGDDKYYNADGTSAKNWDIANGATLYAKWVCPVLKDAIYDETADKWTYIYEDTTGADLEAAPTDEILTKQGISDNTPSGAKQITSVDEPKTKYVENKVKEAEDINLNHYTDTALDQLYKNVISTNTDLKRNKLSQIELNEYVANMARYLEINAPENKKTETVKPNVKLYETKNKVKSIKNDTLTKDLSVIGENYSKPNSNDAGTFVYTNKWSYFKEEAVDYYIYTNSRTPVIALEIDDGEVGTTVTNNSSSYPTNSVITADGNDEIVADKANSFMHSAIPATDDLNNAWFSTYTKANIGTRYDYNAKEIIYLTPSFTPDDPTSTTDEIVYTIKPSDNAVKENTGIQKAQIGQIPTEQADSFSSFKDSECPTDKESITVCICYHNAMNGTSDEGGVYGDPYFQMYINQLDEENAYMDTWLQQMRLFRQSGGASNWEIVLANESVYPVEDETYKDTKFVLGSFAYVFDSTNEPVAMSYAEAGDYDAAKNAIINSIKKTPSEKQAGILDKSHSEHLSVKGGVGLFALDYWSANFYPRQGSYVYVHLIDRWGNYFNKIWKCFKVDEYSAMISGKASTGFILNEDGGSNLATMTLECDDINLLTDVDSTFEDNIFITSGNTFVISTGKPKTKFVLSVVDHAGNELKGNIPTDADGNIKFTVEDPCADLSSGAYTFMLNDKEINLYAREPAVVRSASMTPVAFLGEEETVEIKTSADAIKVQLDENGATRTFTKDSPAVTVTENEDGTITWTIKISGLTCGEHEFGVNAKNSAGWHESNLTVKTLIVKEAIDYDKAIVSVSKVKINKGERVFAKVEVKKDTQAIRVKYDPDNYQTTVYRDNCNIQETEDGTEIWTVPAITFTKAGEYELNVYARCNNEWQTSLGESCFVTVGEKSVKDAAIYIVNVEKNELKLGEQTEITVITNSEATKIQLVYFGTTTTYTADNAEVTANEDGTITWVINRSFANIGTMDVVFKAKSSLGWTDGENFGTITITK